MKEKCDNGKRLHVCRRKKKNLIRVDIQAAADSSLRCVWWKPRLS